MENQLLVIETSLQIQKPAGEVFEAIVNPMHMSNYFISKGSARLEDGKKVLWRFPEFDIEFPVMVVKTEAGRYISFTWDNEGKELLVEISLETRSDGSTVVKVTENGMENTEAGISWLKGNTAGWANFLSCLKAYLEYGINLRKGAFDFMREQSR